LNEQLKESTNDGGRTTAVTGLLSAVQREAIIASALALVGTPFRHQGKDANTGLDCRGVLLAIAQAVGYRFTQEYRSDYHADGDPELIRTALNNEFRLLRSLEHAQPADIVFMRLPRKDQRPRHVGVFYEGPYETMLIHSLAIDHRGAIVADPLRRWLKYVADAYTWRPEQFAAHCSLPAAY
jgi:NlpC/P60 family protein